MAPTTSAALSGESPARVMTSSRALPAVEWFLGVSPIHAAKSRPDLNNRGSGVFIMSNDALIGPTPGIFANLWLHSSLRCQTISFSSTRAISPVSAVFSCPCSANSSRASAGIASSAAILTSPLFFSPF